MGDVICHNLGTSTRTSTSHSAGSMVSNSMATQSTASGSQTTRSSTIISRSTHTVRYYRKNGETLMRVPSFHLCWMTSVVLLCRWFLTQKRSLGLLVSRQQLRAKERRRIWQLTRYRWLSKLRAYPSYLRSATQRMYWRIILPRPEILVQIRIWANSRRVQNRIKSMFPTSLRKTARQKFGESDGIT